MADSGGVDCSLGEDSPESDSTASSTVRAVSITSSCVHPPKERRTVRRAISTAKKRNNLDFPRRNKAVTSFCQIYNAPPNRKAGAGFTVMVSLYPFPAERASGFLRPIRITDENKSESLCSKTGKNNHLLHWTGK